MAGFPVIDLLAVRRTVLPGAVRLPTRKAARMTIAPDSGSGPTIDVPFAPRGVEHSNLAGDFVIVDRPGLVQQIVYQNPLLPTMHFTLQIADQKQQSQFAFHASAGFVVRTITTAIQILSSIQTYASQGRRLRIAYGAFESGLWYITSYSFTTIHRDVLTDEVTYAEADLTLTRATDVSQGLGPTTGGVAPSSPPVTVAPKPVASSPRTWPVHSGDTLWEIAVKEYGNGSKWPIIAKANGIKDPRNLPVGKRLVIP